jgi:hypothetical protein
MRLHGSTAKGADIEAESLNAGVGVPLSMSLKESIRPQNHQINISISTNKQQDDDFVGELDFLKPMIE